LSKHKPNLKKILDNKSVFSGTSKIIQNKILESITAILNKEIEKEISIAPFFSWQIDETTDIQGVSEIRVITLTSKRTRQSTKLFSITFCKIRKIIPRFSIFCNHENLNFDYFFFSITMELCNKALFLSQQKIFALTP
jgi:hypothetical protein